MDFIERIFGVSPDGGSGALEFLLFFIPLAAIAVLVIRRVKARRGGTESRGGTGRRAKPGARHGPIR